MKKELLSILLVCCMVFSSFTSIGVLDVFAEEEPVSAIYGGGPFVTGGSSVVNDIKASGFNTVMLWAVHIHDNGDLFLNDLLVCKDGQYVGKQSWINNWKSLKEGKTSVKRIELSIGAWGSTAFRNIKKFVNQEGTGPDTILYRNFKALIDATGADAVNYDDESTYDVDSLVKFSEMCAGMGMKVTLCPYTYSSFWREIKDQLGDVVDRVYLQCYAGGSGNEPSYWEREMGMKVIPGLWCINNYSGGDSAREVQSAMESWKDNIDGGFMWLYDDMMKLSNPNATADYAHAILNGCR